MPRSVPSGVILDPSALQDCEAPRQPASTPQIARRSRPTVRRSSLSHVPNRARPLIARFRTIAPLFTGHLSCTNALSNCLSLGIRENPCRRSGSEASASCACPRQTRRLQMISCPPRSRLGREASGVNFSPIRRSLPSSNRVSRDITFRGFDDATAPVPLFLPLSDLAPTSVPSSFHIVC